jgi:hypothetical protein
MNAYTRRDFARLTALAAGGLSIAACATHVTMRPRQPRPNTRWDRSSRSTQARSTSDTPKQGQATANPSSCCTAGLTTSTATPTSPPSLPHRASG